MDYDQIKAMMQHTLAIEALLEDIRIGISDEHGDEIAANVLINVATGLLAEVLHVMPPVALEEMWEDISKEVGIKIGAMKVEHPEAKAIHAAVVRAITGDMTCYPDKSKKH